MKLFHNHSIKEDRIVKVPYKLYSLFSFIFYGLLVVLRHQSLEKDEEKTRV